MRMIFSLLSQYFFCTRFFQFSRNVMITLTFSFLTIFYIFIGISFHCYIILEGVIKDVCYPFQSNSYVDMGHRKNTSSTLLYLNLHLLTSNFYKIFNCPLYYIPRLMHNIQVYYTSFKCVVIMQMPSHLFLFVVSN